MKKQFLIEFFKLLGFIFFMISITSLLFMLPILIGYYLLGGVAYDPNAHLGFWHMTSITALASFFCGWVSLILLFGPIIVIITLVTVSWRNAKENIVKKTPSNLIKWIKGKGIQWEKK